MRDQRLTSFAKDMRKQPSPSEQTLWLALRAKRFEGTKFRRQKVIGPYIVDFASRDPMLVIEVDGDTHADRETYDAKRSEYLEEQGYRVIRFTNEDVMSNIDGVLETLATVLAPPPTPSPKGEGA